MYAYVLDHILPTHTCMYVERERTQSFVFMYMHTQVYLETDWISGMAY